MVRPGKIENIIKIDNIILLKFSNYCSMIWFIHPLIDHYGLMYCILYYLCSDHGYLFKHRRVLNNILTITHSVYENKQ